jgi:hypothetical protein
MNTFRQFVNVWLAGRRDDEVAPAFGVVKNCIRGWRLGEHLLPTSKIPKYAPIFGISPDRLRLMIEHSRVRSSRRMVRK